MELNKNENNQKVSKSSEQKIKMTLKKNKNNSNKDIRLLKTNYYLNDFNYYNKNILKMNKLREKKIREHKQKTNNDKKENEMPKILYFNKFMNNHGQKSISKNNLKTISNANLLNSSGKIKKNNEIYNKITQAIISKSIEENSKTHIKRTIKAFDELLKSVDNFELKNKRKRPQLLLEQNNNSNKNNELNQEESNYKENESDDDINIENYNFDEYKKQYETSKRSQRNNRSQTETQTKPNNGNEIVIQINGENLLEKNNNDINENIYITAQNTKMNDINKSIQKNEKNYDINKNESPLKSIDNLKLNKKNNKKNLTINNMIMISDDNLASQIKKIRRNFKKELYFNTNNFGKFKITELGLNYPQSFDKYKKFPDYKGNDIEERRMFNYKSKVTNPNYNYTNIGSFNEKFNKDLSDISNYYGKEQAKGRFIRNPLISMFSRYIPKYEQYKDLKFIENRYTNRNKYMFRLKPLINKGKNNFDRLASNVYNKEHNNKYME